VGLRGLDLDEFLWRRWRQRRRQHYHRGLGGLGAGQQQQLKARRRSILTAPGFDANLVALCRIIAKIGATP
jgi:hypothetical protein